MNLQERVLGVLSCRYVDEVVMGAPLIASKHFLEAINASVVVCGSLGLSLPHGEAHYADAKAMGIFKQLTSTSKLTTNGIVARILSNYSKFEERNKKKEAKEASESGTVFSS
eukprot:TRINITY_DN2715_c0_g2_i1.p1 TRINITY_DN2715_c0_g2~~TRINITY_DN2715_c0_g2_i1.p1  ORF type:complete len:112 (-),score=13.76 TRINITY_DN2715_c0_g2_i1:78-413(-)